MFNRKHSLKIESISKEAVSAMKNYSWPGNIRELKNIIERTALTTRQGIIKPEDIKIAAPEISEDRERIKQEIPEIILSGTMNEIKYRAAEKALEQSRYNKSLAAKKLGIDRSTLDRLLENVY